MKNLLIGAISGNYSPNDLKNWVETSNWDDCERVLLLYNPSNNGLEEYLKQNDIKIILPKTDFWGNEKINYEYNTGVCTTENSYELIHNIRFYHIWYYLETQDSSVYRKILITDVKDVYFNNNPFDSIEIDKILATGEIIKYKDEEWNQTHLHYNLGVIGLNTLLDKQVYNVGVFGGGYEIVKSICADIYLMSVGKYKVADQTSYNYLIYTKYAHKTLFTNDIAVHLHVINAGLVPFDLKTIPNYKIVHQYDRIPGFRR
jgi:hypothetical protein